VGREIPPETARDIIGLGLKAAQKQLFPGEVPGAEFLSVFHRAYRENYEAGESALELYEGAFDLVQELKRAGKTVAVATAKSRAGIDRSLKATGLADFIAHTRTPEECRPKPDPQMIHEILNEAGLGPNEAVMVGDTTHDLQMARRAAVTGIGLTYGAHVEARLMEENPLALCGDIAALREILLPVRS